MNEKHCSIIQIYILSININAYTKFDRNPQISKQDIEHKKILTSIKDHNSVKNRTKIMYIRQKMDLVCINAYTKFYQNVSICSEDIEEKHIFTSIKGHNTVVYKRI